MDPDRQGIVDLFDSEHQGADDMADDQQREIGRRVVRALVKEFLAAHRAGIVDLEIGAKQQAFAAIRAAQTETALDRLPAAAVGSAGKLICATAGLPAALIVGPSSF